MASAATFKMVGDWSKQMDIPISNALAATIEMTGRSAKQAVGMAMVYMARSARAMTKQAPKNMKRGSDEQGEYWRAERKGGYNIYSWWWKIADGAIRSKTIKNYVNNYSSWQDAKRIPNRGLAKRSWFWGIAGLKGAETTGKPIPGVSTLHEYLSETKCGLILQNRLGYILKAAPTNVGDLAASKASSQIMAQVAKKLESRFSAEVPRLAAARAKKAAKKFRQVYQAA